MCAVYEMDEKNSGPHNADTILYDIHLQTLTEQN